MSQDKQIVWRGLAVGVGFVGVFTPLLSDTTWPLSIALVSISILLWMIGEK